MAIRDQLAEFSYNLKFEDLPPDIVDFTRLLIMDQLGLTIGGARSIPQEENLDIAGFFKEMGGKEESSLAAEGAKVPCINAAFSNTAAGFAGGFDALHHAAIHLPCCLVPATIAAAEWQHASGRDLILATVIGAEIITRASRALGPTDVYNRGFHPTSLCAPFGCAVATGKFMGMGKDELAEAISIAGTQGAGFIIHPVIHGVQRFPRTQRIQQARAAQGGVMAALLARMGVVGIADIFEDPRGFLSAHSPNPDQSKLTEGLGTGFDIKKMTMKRFGVGIYVIPGLDTLLDLFQKHDIRAENVERMVYKLPTPVVRLVGAPGYPKDGFGCNISARYLLAVAAVQREGIIFSRDHNFEPSLKDPRHIEMFERIDCVAAPELDKLFPEKWPSILTVTTKDGKEYSQLLDGPVKGDPENPLTQQELETRFGMMVTPVLGQQTCDRMLEILRRLEDAKDVSDLAGLMAGR